MAETLWDAITDLLAPEAGRRRRAALDRAVGDAVMGLLGPTGIPERLAPVAEAVSPVASMERAGAASQRVFDPSLDRSQRIAAGGEMLSEMAGTALPGFLAARYGAPAAQAIEETLLGFSQPARDAGSAIVERLNQPGQGGGPVTLYSNPFMVARDFDVSRRDASNIFGEGSERVRYTDPQSGGTMEVVVRPNGQASVLELEVPEQFRGQGIGQSLQARVMQDFPIMGGQVSSKAAAKTAYRLGRRPYGQPDATLEDVFRMIDEDSSVNLISPQAQPNILPAPRNEAEAMAKQVLEMRAAGRAGDVTDEMMAAADPQYMYANTPLPMDYESRMARAREMGFDTAVYHGGTSDIRALSPFEGGAEGGHGVLFSSDEARVANTYAPRRAQPMGENVMPLIARSGGYREAGYTRPFPADGSDAEIENWLAGLEQFDRRMSQPGVKSNVFSQQIEAARENNQPGVVFRQVVDDRIDTGAALPSDVFATVDPTTIRSSFARFDPDFRHLRNLSAGFGGLGLLSYPDEEQ